MPLYEYRCESCARLFEAYKRLAEKADEEKCPSCGGRSRRLKISLFSAQGTAGTSPKGTCGTGFRRSPFN
ncbi:MAG: zinc ribbon domain-containing protein [Deltaproteobacteria bacterium]|nr:zinc ribbon domain-containing protein [Deltaproteobacteria bacterium]